MLDFSKNAITVKHCIVEVDSIKALTNTLASHGTPIELMNPQVTELQLPNLQDFVVKVNYTLDY